jgi:hypothetical protein
MISFFRPALVALSSFVWLSASHLFADDPIILNGGLSPNGKLSVVIAENNNWYESGPEWPQAPKGMLDISKAYLYGVAEHRVIGPFEEFDTTGGGFGMSVKNVKPSWSPDSSYLAISYRCGRLDNDVVLYRVVPFQNSWRAIPQQFPKENSGPHGSEIFSHLSRRANGGRGVDKWLSPSEFKVIAYGFFPPTSPSAVADYFNDDGEIGIVYSYSNGNWRVERYLKPPILGTPQRPIED